MQFVGKWEKQLNTCHDSLCLGRDFNPVLYEYDAGVLQADVVWGPINDFLGFSSVATMLVEN